MSFSEYMKNSTKNIVISKVCSLLEKNPSKIWTNYLIYQLSL